MKMFGRVVPLLFFCALSLLPLQAYAANTSFMQIFPAGCYCPGGAPDWGCVLETIRNLINVAIAFGVVVTVLIIAYAGALLMFSPFHAENKSKAKTMLLNAVIGLAIALAGWLIVDFVMKTLYNESASAEGVAQLGPWNSILGEGRQCVLERTPPSNWLGDTVGQAVSQTVSTLTGSGANCPVADPDDMVPFPANVTIGETETATPTTVENFLAMRAAALEDGIDLKVTDGYRSDAEQVTEWNRCNAPGATCRAAKPCSLGGGGSNHNSGQAIDINVGCSNGQSGCNTPAYNWLQSRGNEWDFRNAVENDPLHWSPSGN